MNLASHFNGLMPSVRKLQAHCLNNSATWLMLAGLAVMFLPTIYGLFAVSGLWLDDEHSHGPIILCISLWLLWKRWHGASDLSSFKPAPTLAWVCFMVAVALYVPGRALDIIYFETGAFVWALTS